MSVSMTLSTAAPVCRRILYIVRPKRHYRQNNISKLFFLHMQVQIQSQMKLISVLIGRSADTAVLGSFEGQHSR